MSNVALTLNFSDCDFVLRDAEVLKKVPTLMRAVECENPDWDDNVKITATMRIPFPSTAGKFVFDHVLKYESPNDQPETVSASKYPEAVALSLDDLRDVIECANYFECIDFVDCIGLVIAEKLKPKDVEYVAAFFGLEALPADHPDAVWVHPTLSSLANGM